MSTPLVSVIVVTYNQESSISRALSSIVSQRCDFPFEIVIGDDGSTDSTRHVCEDFAMRYPEIVRLMPKASNKGVVDNYFDCLDSCRGEFVADCAGDDYWPDEHRLSQQTDYLRRNPECVAVMSDWEIIRGGIAELSSRIPAYAPFTHNVSGRSMMKLVLGSVDVFPHLSAMMFRRGVLEPLLSDNQVHLVRNKHWKCEDLPILAALSAKGDFGYLPLRASAYEMNLASVSNSPSPVKQFDFYIGPARAVAALSNAYRVDAAEIRRGLDERIKYLASMLWQAPSSQRLNELRTLCGVWPAPVPFTALLRIAMLRVKLALKICIK